MNKGLVDTVVLMRPPQEWWPRGVVGYPGDHNGILASKSGEVPDSSVVAKEFNALTELLVRYNIPHVIMNFPSELDYINQPPQGAYDAVFLRDCAVVAPSGTSYVPARFRDCRRQVETQFITKVFDALGLERLCEVEDIPGFVEGGDTVNGVLPTGEKYLFTGLQRNNKSGNDFLCEIMAVPKSNHVNIGTELCHIDSLMCAAGRTGKAGQVLQFLILCPDLISSGLQELTHLIDQAGVNISIIAHCDDTSSNGGSLAINGISVQSATSDYLITGAKFNSQPVIEGEICRAGFSHIYSKLTQYLKFSSGGVRCSTQVVRVPMSALYNLQKNQPIGGIEKVWISTFSNTN